MIYNWNAHRSAILVSGLIKNLNIQKFFKKLPNIKFYLNPFSIFEVVTKDRQMDRHGRAKRCTSF
jgi:hypothetical protein